MSELTKHLITSIVLIALWGVSLMVAAYFATKPVLIALTPALAPIEETQKHTEGAVTINTDTTTCRSQNMNGWSRIRTSDEDYVNALVKQGRAVTVFGQTLKCTDISKNPLVTIHLREPWWQKVPRQVRTAPAAPQPVPAPPAVQGGIHRPYHGPTAPATACGDYTRPDAPWPVVVGV